MTKSFTTSTILFLQEGRNNLRRTLRAAFRAASLHRIERIVVFTATGQGVRIAIEEFLPLPEYERIKLVAVTFAMGKTFTDREKRVIKVEIPSEAEVLFRERRIPIVRAHLPFDPISSPYADRAPLAQSLSLVGDALNMFGGSMSLCVQAVTLACDAGEIDLGEHVISLTSDTAVLVQATSTSRMLKDLIIREILCKPAVLSISKGETSQDVLPELDRSKDRRRRLVPRAE